MQIAHQNHHHRQSVELPSLHIAHVLVVLHLAISALSTSSRHTLLRVRTLLLILSRISCRSTSWQCIASSRSLYTARIDLITGSTLMKGMCRLFLTPPLGSLPPQSMHSARSSQQSKWRRYESTAPALHIHAHIRRRRRGRVRFIVCSCVEQILEVEPLLVGNDLSRSSSSDKCSSESASAT